MTQLILLFRFLTLLSVFGYTRCIYLGKNVQIKEFPYQVSVRANDQHVCGGVIIDKTRILTAAHCLLYHNNPRYQYSIRAGSSLHSKGEKYSVGDIIVHQKYNHTNLDLDIAILKLSSGSYFKTDSNIRPVELQTENLFIADCIVSGWGETEYEDISTKLKAAEVSLITNEECSTYFGGITPNKICARSSKCAAHDLIAPKTFSGDSGGPIVCNNKLVGLLSGGINRVYRVYRDFPSVYTKISALHNWIVKNNQHNYCSII